MKIGIFGGTFNPVHQGHIHLVQCCIEELGLDRLLVIPTKQPPHKKADDLAPGSHRAQLCRLAFAHIPQVQVSELELEREGKSYTADTISALRRQYPEAQFYLLVGSDMFFTFHQWKRFEEILSQVTLCTASRTPDEAEELDKAKEKLQTYSSNLCILKNTVLELSSTQVRQLLHSHRDCSAVLPEAVYDYILKNRLYCGSIYEEKLAGYIWLLRRLLKPKRFTHSLNVAAQAVNLAALYGEDIQKAQVAGLLHDVCKNMPQEEQLQWVKKSAIILDDAILKQPHLWHGFAAAGYLVHELNITDENIINAVRYHTVARANMSRLEEIIYLADLTSDERDFPGADRMRGVVQTSLKEGMVQSLCYTIEKLLNSRAPICYDTYQAYNWYSQQ